MLKLHLVLALISLVTSSEIVEKRDRYTIYKATEEEVAGRINPEDDYSGWTFSYNSYNGSLPSTKDNFGDLELAYPSDATLYSSDIISGTYSTENTIIRYNKEVDSQYKIVGLEVVNSGEDRGYAIWAGYLENEVQAQVVIAARKNVNIYVNTYAVRKSLQLLNSANGVNLNLYICAVSVFIILYNKIL